MNFDKSYLSNIDFNESNLTSVNFYQEPAIFPIKSAFLATGQVVKFKMSPNS